MWTQDTRPTTYGHWLAWQITVEHSIDPADGVEPVEKITSDFQFQGEVIIKCKKQALEEAISYQTGLVMWTDGSKLDQGNTGAAVCWKDRNTDQWKEKSIFLGKNKEILDAELWAIWKALEIALKEITNTRDIPVTVFCDSQKALDAIKRPPSWKENRFLRGMIYLTAKKLQENGNKIVFHWVPGHAGLIGNEKANLAAKIKAERGGRKTTSIQYLETPRRNMRRDTTSLKLDTEQ